MLGDELIILRACIVGIELAKEMLRKEDYSSFVIKELREANTWFEKKEQRKITYSMGGNETEIDYCIGW